MRVPEPPTPTTETGVALPSCVVVGEGAVAECAVVVVAPAIDAAPRSRSGAAAGDTTVVPPLLTAVTPVAGPRVPDAHHRRRRGTAPEGCPGEGAVTEVAVAVVAPAVHAARGEECAVPAAVAAEDGDAGEGPRSSDTDHRHRRGAAPSRVVV